MTTLPQDVLARLWGALTLDGNGNLAIRTTATILGSAVVHDANMDWGTGANQVYAGSMPILDTGGYFTTDTVEAALQQIGASIASGQAPAAAKYILQVANGSLANAQALGALTTGIVKNTTTTGVLSIAAEGTDYYKPGGTKVQLADGGANAALVASLGGIVYSTTTALAVLAGTATAGQMLRSGSSAAPTWSTAVWPATTTVNQLLYSSSSNVIAGLATGNSGVLVTSSGGIPSIGTDLPTAVTIGGAYVYRAAGTDVALLDGGTNASLTADKGAIVYSGQTGLALLAHTATAGQLVQSGSSDAPTWSTATYPATATGTGKLLRADGTNWVASTLTIPDTAAISTILYASASNVISALATANYGTLNTGATGIPSITATPQIQTSLTLGVNSTTTGQLLMKNASNTNTVTIQALAGGGAYTLTLPTDGGTANYLLQTDGSGNTSWVTPPTSNVSASKTSATYATTNSTASAVTLLTYTINGNTSVAGDLYEVYLNASFNSNDGGTCTIALILGSTTILSKASVAADTQFTLRGLVGFDSIGASAKITGDWFIHAANGTSVIDARTTLGAGRPAAETAKTADSTGSLALKVDVTMGTSNSGNSISFQHGYIRKMNSTP